MKRKKSWKGLEREIRLEVVRRKQKDNGGKNVSGGDTLNSEQWGLKSAKFPIPVLNNTGTKQT